MRELSVAEQRYQAVLAVIKDGRTVTETAAAVGVSRQTLHVWLAKYEAGGLEGLVDRSHRPHAHPWQMPPRRRYWRLGGPIQGWGTWRIVIELARKGVTLSRPSAGKDPAVEQSSPESPSPR
jgi:transposase